MRFVSPKASNSLLWAFRKGRKSRFMSSLNGEDKL